MTLTPEQLEKAAHLLKGKWWASLDWCRYAVCAFVANRAAHDFCHVALEEIAQAIKQARGE